MTTFHLHDFQGTPSYTPNNVIFLLTTSEQIIKMITQICVL